MTDVNLQEAAAILTTRTGRRLTVEGLRKRLQRAERGSRSHELPLSYRKDASGRYLITIDEDSPLSAMLAREQSLTTQLAVAERRAAEAEAKVARLEKVIDALLAKGDDG